MPKWKSRCPYFSSCVEPCIHGMSNYYFVTHTCLTADHKICVTYAGLNPATVLGPIPAGLSLPQAVLGPRKKRNRSNPDWRIRTIHPELGVLDDLQECPRLGWCMKKSQHPVEEYKEIVCKTPEHGHCLFYFCWYQNGSDPNDRMEDVEMHGDYFEQLEDTVQAVTGQRPHFRASYPVVDARGFTAEEINGGKLYGNVKQS